MISKIAILLSHLLEIASLPIPYTTMRLNNFTIVLRRILCSVLKPYVALQ